MDYPVFSLQELRAIEDDARGCLLSTYDEHWTPLVIDLARALRIEMEQRLHGTTPTGRALHL